MPLQTPQAVTTTDSRNAPSVLRQGGAALGDPRSALPGPTVAETRRVVGFSKGPLDHESKLVADSARTFDADSCVRDAGLHPQCQVFDSRFLGLENAFPVVQPMKLFEQRFQWLGSWRTNNSGVGSTTERPRNDGDVIAPGGGATVSGRPGRAVKPRYHYVLPYPGNALVHPNLGPHQRAHLAWSLMMHAGMAVLGVSVKDLTADVKGLKLATARRMLEGDDYGSRKARVRLTWVLWRRLLQAHPGPPDHAVAWLLVWMDQHGTPQAAYGMPYVRLNADGYVQSVAPRVPSASEPEIRKALQKEREERERKWRERKARLRPSLRASGSRW